MERGCEINNTLSIIRLNTFFQSHYPDGYIFKGEYHDFHEVVCVLSGEILVTSGKDIYTLKAGEMTYHPPGEFHAFREESGTRPNTIIFSFEASSFPDIHGKIFKLKEHNLGEIEELYTKLLRIFDFEPLEKPGKSIWIKNVKVGEETAATVFIKRLELFLISTLSHEISDNEHKKATKGSQSFYKILTVMEENISKTLDVGSIASLCGISIPTLEKTVYRFLGYGAMTHYNILKMQKAYNMLLEGFSVKETALSLGFLNQNYFSARFKKHYGFPPSRVSCDLS